MNFYDSQLRLAEQVSKIDMADIKAVRNVLYKEIEQLGISPSEYLVLQHEHDIKLYEERLLRWKGELKHREQYLESAKEQIEAEYKGWCDERTN